MQKQYLATADGERTDWKCIEDELGARWLVQADCP